MRGHGSRSRRRISSDRIAEELCGLHTTEFPCTCNIMQRVCLSLIPVDSMTRRSGWEWAPGGSKSRSRWRISSDLFAEELCWLTDDYLG